MKTRETEKHLNAYYIHRHLTKSGVSREKMEVIAANRDE